MKRYTIILTAVAINIVSTACNAETSLHITTGFTPPVSDFYNSVLKEVDRRLAGVSISFEVLPAERSLALANQGINDGDCCRIPGVVTGEYSKLIPVNESFFTARFSVFTKRSDVAINSFDDLKPYSVGTVEGWKIAVQKIKMIDPEELHLVTTPEQLVLMLDQDRLEFGVVGYLSGLESIAKLKLESIKAIEPPLIEKQLYLMLHQKHKNLVPVFDSMIKEMQKDGTIDRLYNELIYSLK